MDARGALIPKNDGSDRKRAIGIGDVLYRSMGAACSATIATELGRKLAPIQLAVGVSGGVEIAAILADLGGDQEDLASYSLDVKNAYGTIKRSCVYRGLQKYCPGLLKWFCYGYGRPVGIRDHQGARVGQAETGIFIGDGFGTIFYCVGAQDYYLGVENALHDLEARRGVPDAQRGFLSIIADDVTIKAKTDIVMELAPVVAPILAEAGLVLNPSKSFILGPRVLQADDAPANIPLCREGRKALGRPLGPLSYQSEEIQAIIERASPPTAAMMLIKPEAAFRHLKYCHSRKFDYLLKVTPSLAVCSDDVFATFDTNTVGSVQTVLGFTPREGIAGLCNVKIGLPPHLGGLGITPVAGLTGFSGMKLRYVAFQRTKCFLEQHYPLWIPRLEDRYGPLYGHKGFADEVEYFMEEITNGERFQRQVRAAAKVCDNELELLNAKIHGMLVGEERYALAARFLADIGDTGSQWLTAASDPFIVGSPFASGPEFCEAARYRVLAAFSGDGTSHVTCDCHRQGQPPVDLNDSDDHPEVCRRNWNVVCDRHTAIKVRLAQLIKKVSGQGVQVVVEPPPAPGERKPDIRVERNGEVHYIDVVVACPSSREALERGSWQHPGKAAELAEERKRQQYAGRGQVVIPFAVESHGRLGAEAKKYLGRLAAKASEDVMWKFKRDISHILAFHLGRAQLLTRQRCHHGEAEDFNAESGQGGEGAG
jgi:hypothetical protein